MRHEMRKETKLLRVCCYALLLVLILSVTGCGSKKTEETDNGKNTEQEESKDNSEKENSDEASADGDEEDNEDDNEDEKLVTGTYQKGAFFQFGMVPAKTEDKKWGFMDMSGEWAIEPTYRSVHAFGPSGLAFVSLESKKWNIINTSGDKVSDRVYTYVNPFSVCGIAAVQEKTDDGMKNYYIYTDADGKLIEYDATKWNVTGNFSDDGYAIVSVWDDETTTDTYALINTEFEYVIEPTKGFRPSNIHNGMFTVIDETNRFSGMMNTKGEWVFKTDGYLDSFMSCSYANGRILDRYGVIRDIDGNFVVDVSVITKDLPMGPYSAETSKSYEYGDWLLIESGKVNSSFNVNYLDENYNVVFPYPIHLYTNDSYGTNYGDMRYGRLVVELPVEKDASGKVTGISDVSDNDSEYQVVVIDENKNIVYVPAEIGCQSVRDYCSDGYTYARTGNKEFGILDRSGEILFTVKGVDEFKAE